MISHVDITLHVLEKREGVVTWCKICVLNSGFQPDIFSQLSSSPCQVAVATGLMRKNGAGLTRGISHYSVEL